MRQSEAKVSMAINEVPNKSIRDTLNRAGISNVPSVVTGGEIIMASDFNRPAPELTESQCINVRAV
jgi:hypothetical protein